MDLKSKILIGIFLAAVVASIAFTYKRIMVDHAFEAVQEEASEQDQPEYLLPEEAAVDVEM